MFRICALLFLTGATGCDSGRPDARYPACAETDAGRHRPPIGEVNCRLPDGGYTGNSPGSTIDPIN